jgi:hypothetical protein
MKMKKALLLFAGAFLLCACTVNFRSLRKKHQPLTTSTPTVKPFERIEVAGSFDVFYQQGDTTSVRIEAPSETLKKMDVYSDGHTLHIGMEHDLTDLSFASFPEDVKVYVTSPDLIAVELAGSGDFKGQGRIDTDNLKLSIAGSGEISLDDVICNALKADIAGSGDVKLDNVATATANFSIAGSGDIKAHFSQCENVKTDIAGSGDVKLSGHVKTHQESIAGSGEVDATAVVSD